MPIRKTTAGGSLPASIQKPVALGRDDGKTVLANHDELRTLNVATDGILTPALAQSLDDAFSWGTAGALSPDDSERVGIATRYHDQFDGEGFGAVRGDGRAVLVGEGVARADGRVVGVRELQLKGGVNTGLAPNGAEQAGGHHDGGLALDWALVETTFSDFLRKNGVKTQSWVALQVIDGWKARLVRSGDMTRLAHLRFAVDDSASLKSLVKSINTRVAVDLGRAALLTPAGLTRVLIDRKATELADLWWLRAVHQSTTYDNIGLFEVIDLSTATTVVRPDDDRFGHTSAGFLNEPRAVMGTFAPDIAWFVDKGSDKASGPGVSARDAQKLGTRLLHKRMAERALEHIGFDVDDCARVLHKKKPEVAAFIDAFAAVVAARVEAKSPKAKYDAFAGLAAVVDLAAPLVATAAPAGVHLDTQAAALLARFKPLGVVGPDDDALARRLLDAAKPLVAHVLSSVSGVDVVDEKLACIRDQAVAINAPCEDLAHASLMHRAQGAVARIHSGNAREVEADVNVLLRRNLRRGPEAAHHVAMRLRRDELPKVGDEVVLSSIIEHGVTIEERSNGVADRVVVTVAPGAAEAGALYQGGASAFADPSQIIAQVVLKSGTAPVLVKPTVVDGKAVFSLPLGAAPEELLVTFTNAAQNVWWDNNLMHFGQGHRPVLSSVLLQAELAALADRTGAMRTRGPSGRAVTNRRPDRVRRSRPAVLEKLQTADQLRQLSLQAPRAQRP